MVRPETLDEELFGMASKREHFAVTRLELLLVHLRLSLGLARCTRFRLLCARRATFRFCPFSHGCAGLRFGLGFALLLRGTRLFLFRRCFLLIFVRLPLRRTLLLIRRLSQGHEWQHR